MDRLTCKYDEQNALRELCSFGRKSDIEADDCLKCDEYCDMVVKECKDTDYPCDKCAIQKAFDKLAEYEDLEEQGLLLKLPCKIGDTVYQIPSKANYDLNVLHGYYEHNRVYHQKVSKIVLDGEYWYLECDKDREYGTGRICLDRFFGETWFLTKEEAEQALKRLER